MNNNQNILETAILPVIQKPGRYLGNEPNVIHKDWDQTKIKIVLSYPDLYEIGMSNLAIQILYHIINSDPDCLCERAFMPYPDFSAKLKEKDLPLMALESWRALNEFDFIGYSLGYELNYTNVLSILKQSDIPLLQKDRAEARKNGKKSPIVFGGGMNVSNPEPVVPFFDFFLFGEAEDVLPQILASAKKHLGLDANNYDAFFEEISKLDGVYVPHLKLNKPIQRAFVKNLDMAPFPVKPIVPIIETIHDRAAIEIMRGCPWRCKFCLSGATEKPVRFRHPKTVIDLAEQLVKNTGAEELSLLSLSTSDYPFIEQVARDLTSKFHAKRVSISVPSMRTDSFSIKIAKEILKVRQATVTLAPEAGTQRLRDVIDKRISEEQIIEGVSRALSEGVNSIKLYFMIGLPTETDEDLLGICQLCEKLLNLSRDMNRRTRIHIGLSTFVPKPHTPFEKEKQISIQETLEKQELIKRNLNRKIDIRWHDAKSSFLEGVFSRGDQKLAPVLIKAVELGCGLDAWTEHMRFDVWMEAFKQCNVDPNQYLNARPEKEPLAWDYLNIWDPACGISSGSAQ
jgi:radical SAM family uncharacterized protein